ncbi:hypothetical protein CX676_16180 [Paracoccus zhejiangensis]|uniref:Uncharacterized protein n=1 Tax=Paracoccus zhejiangensis TaxID=1077935 RepID=A0A2H5F1U7_9RHOB|nr:hypothetical protein CX676_16180 [Paracoccus zhejiangensis]
MIFCSGWEQLWQSGEISGGQRHDEASPCAFNAAINGLDGTSDGFGPAESLLEPLQCLKERA